MDIRDLVIREAYKGDLVWIEKLMRGNKWGDGTVMYIECAQLMIKKSGYSHALSWSLMMWVRRHKLSNRNMKG